MEKVIGEKLTNRETEVLKLMLQGVSNAFIAKELGVTESTVKAHISHIFEKLNVQNRVQAVVKAVVKKII